MLTFLSYEQVPSMEGLYSYLKRRKCIGRLAQVGHGTYHVVCAVHHPVWTDLIVDAQINDV